ncbi:MAG: hypothetical protein F4X41_00445 [Chloroflexi bacterium]|nr:hypothetical protein [Chloroflexota bacterium]
MKNVDKIQALSTLRELRDELGQENAPRRVNLRAHIPQNSPAWKAFIKVAGVPGRKVRRNTVITRVNATIDSLTTELLDGASEDGPQVSRRVRVSDFGRSRNLANTSGVNLELRRLTPAGITLAREFLSDLRDKPSGAVTPPQELLIDEEFAARFAGDIRLEMRGFNSRREAAAYLSPILQPVSHLIADHSGVWSWIGMLYFPETVAREDGAVKLSPLDETFVVNREDSSTRSYQLRYRHYLWGAWRLYLQHGEQADFLLDRPLTQWGDIEERCFGSTRIFNSIGVVDLILRLYTHGSQQKRGFSRNRAGLRHLIRVLAQLERTFDVYGMDSDALLRILPAEFRQWETQQTRSPARSAAPGF